METCTLIMPLDDFGRVWTTLLKYIEAAALHSNEEISLAALKCLHEVLTAYTTNVQLDINLYTYAWAVRL